MELMELDVCVCHSVCFVLCEESCQEMFAAGLLDIIGVTLETLTNEAQHQPVSAAGYDWDQFLYLDASIVLRASRQTELCFAYKYHVKFQSASPGLVAQLGAR